MHVSLSLLHTSLASFASVATVGCHSTLTTCTTTELSVYASLPLLYASNASFAQPTFLLCYGARLHHSQLNVVNTQYLCNS